MRTEGEDISGTLRACPSGLAAEPEDPLEVVLLKNGMNRGFALLVAVALMVAGGMAVEGKTAWRFAGDRAYQHVKAQVELGVRAPGTPGHDKCVEYIVGALKALKLD